MASKASECTPTPDLLPRFQGKSRFDKTEHGATGRSLAPEIDRNALGPSCHLDAPGRSMGQPRSEVLGAGSESLAEACSSIASGARAPKANWGHLQRGGK